MFLRRLLRKRKERINKMEYSLTNIRWLRTIGIALAIFALSFLVLIIITTGYAFILAFEVRGKPDQVAISQFSASLAPWLMPLLEIVLTFLGALIIPKQSDKNIPVNGLILGIMVMLLSVAMEIGFGGHFDYIYFICLLMIIGSGFLGGFVKQKRIDKKMKLTA
jgi:hypothetical protein